MSNDERYLVVSTDGHCGADLYGYKPYLESQYHDEFDAWAASFSDGWGDLDTELEDFRVGVASYASDVNWVSAKRQDYIDKEGIAAEVLFPNTAPPFFPNNQVSASIPPVGGREYELRSAGLRAHNRWLVDFCKEVPGRRIGIAQTFLNDVDAAVKEIKWAHENGLKGVLLPPDTILQLSNLYYPRLEPIWQICEELGMPLHRHGIAPSEAASEETGIAAPAIGLFEFINFVYRPVVHLILAGVFDQHPNLRLVITEQGTTSLQPVITQMDGYVKHSREVNSISRYFSAPVVDNLKQMPSDYMRQNVYFGSFLDSGDIENRYNVGVDHVMWGADFPHHEGTVPFSREAMSLNFADLPEEETRKMLGLNAVEVYRLDREALQKVANDIGPTPEELRRPVDLDQIPESLRLLCNTFSGNAFSFHNEGE
ncbi:amidohydrolase family protein [Mycobacterium sp. E1747]|uniref:amidohydrolase family protein n=1 Tax=Mycobacterium sp. E1747 TaxID=1834128 RepID=UPI0007FE1EA1|nr:amidohydrolase family protein [Mycobacterium sp. E1747]OBH08880.1 hypothetical protein A5695_25630 [Mycobacterium sp. E1747]